MRVQLLLSATILYLLSSCSGQNNAQSDKKTAVTGVKDSITQLGNNIMVIYQDRNNTYWFGSWETGLYKYDGKKVTHFTTNNGLPGNRVEEIREDSAGNLYVNTTGGIAKYHEGGFAVLPSKYSDKWKLESGDVWFKNLKDSGHVARFDGKIVHRLSFPITEMGKKCDEMFPLSKYPRRGDPYSVYTLYKDSNANIWFGTAVLGVCRWNGKRHDWISSEDVNELHNGPSNGVRSIIEDKDGYFWFCNTIWRYNIYNVQIPANIDSQNKFYYYREKGIFQKEEVRKTGLDKYLSSVCDSNGHVWLVTYMDGVFEWDGNKMIHYPFIVDGKNIPTFCIYKDHAGVLWVGTHENGAYRFNGKTFERFKL